MYYSLPFPVEEGAKYRFQCRWRTNGPAVKVFIKCYDELDTPYHSGGDSRVGQAERAPPEPSGNSPGGARVARPTLQNGNDSPPRVDRLREVYRSQQNLKGPKNTWNTQTEDFSPHQSNYTPRWCRVMLYGYLGAGVVEFDDVVIKQIVPVSPGESVNKVRRPSKETKVTTKEIEEDERRSEEAK